MSERIGQSEIDALVGTMEDAMAKAPVVERVEAAKPRSSLLELSEIVGAITNTDASEVIAKAKEMAAQSEYEWVERGDHGIDVDTLEAIKLTEEIAILRGCRQCGDTLHNDDMTFCSFACQEAAKPTSTRVDVDQGVAEGNGTLVIPGGTKSPPLPEEKAFDGTPDPELAKMIAEGATAYHLDTLEKIAWDAGKAERLAHEEAPSTPKSYVHRRTAMVMSTAGLLAFVAAMGLPSDPPPAAKLLPPPSPLPPLPPESLDEIERVRLEMMGAELARSSFDADVVNRSVGLMNRGKRQEGKTGCRSAACRTLTDCLCRCTKCEACKA